MIIYLLYSIRSLHSISDDSVDLSDRVFEKRIEIIFYQRVVDGCGPDDLANSIVTGLRTISLPLTGKTVILTFRLKFVYYEV